MIKPPIFVLVLKLNRETVLINANSPFAFLPIFSTRSNAELYIRRTKIDCEIEELATRHDVRAFFQNRVPYDTAIERTVIDPTTEHGDTWTPFDPTEFLKP